MNFINKDILKALEDLKEAFSDLNVVWGTDDLLNETKSIGIYPFSKSFDEVTNDVIDWVDSSIEELDVLQQINRHEFANTIIGEGSNDMLRDIFNDNERFDRVIGELSEEFEHVLNENMSKMTVSELTALAKRYGYNVEVIELTTETKEDLLF